jgi:peptidoglycan/xylan/chitin deacetylase (PgdA/CDA1 family)
VPEAVRTETGRAAMSPLDRAGLGLLVLGGGWVLVSALVAGGNPIPALTVLALVGAAVALGRAADPVVVSSIVVGGALAVAVASPIGTFSPASGAGIFDYANAKAALFVQAAAAAAVLGLAVRRRAVRVGAGVAAVIFALVPFLARSYGAVAGLGLVAAGLLPAATGRFRRPAIAVLASAVVVTLAASLWLAVNPPTPDGRLARALDARRISLWQDATGMLQAEPVTGVGPGRFDDLRTTARSDDDARWAHNDFLQQGAETGLPGMILLVAGFGWIFARLWRAPGPLTVLAAGAVSALGVQASVDHVLNAVPVPLMTAALVGTATRSRPGRVTPEVLIRRAAKATVLPLGLAARRRPEDVAILLYHRIGDGTGEISLPVEDFERQIAHLAEHERVLTLEQALEGDSGGVVITFDDGYRDFHDNALPVLVRHRVPATLYLATGLVANGTRPSPDALTWSQVGEAASTGLVAVGSHTHGHADLSRATEGQAEDEMRRSRALVEDHLGRACRHFAYPWAVGSPAADRAARRTFYTAALDAWRTNRRGSIDPYRLGRTPILRSDGWAFFRAKVAGMLDGEALVYRALRRGPWGLS